VILRTLATVIIDDVLATSYIYILLILRLKKNHYLINEFDVIEYNRRVTFDMHDHSGKVKQTKATDYIQPNPYLGYINYTDVTEEFLENIEAESAYEKNFTEKLDTCLRIIKIF